MAVLVLGCVAASADNFVRPLLSRKARLDVPMFLPFIAMLGGIAMFGAWGLLLGPLLVRLAVEGYGSAAIDASSAPDADEKPIPLGTEWTNPQ